ncbi:MAG: glycosyltransferase family 4 protein [Lachnospiraceae bacterium]|nr:glycosyltransferase family 4 protein [Lachnospiraceae bacterium]
MIGHKRIPSREGGVEVVVSELSTRMVKRGHKVVAYNRKGHHVSGEENDGDMNLKSYEGVKIINVPTPQSKQLNAVVYSFFATIRAIFGKYDVVHFHASGPCAMIGLAKLFGVKTVATIHGLDSQRAKWGGFASAYLRFGERMAAKKADEVIVLSENVKRYFYRTYGRRTIYIPNGISKPVIKKANLIEKKYGLKKDEYILFLARIVPEKGLHYLIEAFKKTNTDKKLVIVGGSSHSGDYIEEIHKMIESDERIIATGFLQGEMLEELFSNAYLYVLPSDVEGMPISLLEAMSYGNCCLTSNIAENKNVIGTCGVTFKKSNVKDLRKQLQFLLDNKETVLRFKRKAQRYILSRYNWDDIVDQTIELYKKAARKGKKNK